jgi:hypothetical protein
MPNCDVIATATIAQVLSDWSVTITSSQVRVLDF